MSFIQTFYHIVMATEEHEPCFVGSNRLKLYDDISDVLQGMGCRLVRINAVKEHLHLLCSMHPDVCLTELVNDVKVSSASLIEKDNLFPKFMRWQDEYWAFTCSYKDRVAVSKYIERQPTHHRDITFAEELEAMSKAEGVGRGRKLK
ncbi:MAG: transposase [Candidatus Hydrogenedentota bacterium]